MGKRCAKTEVSDSWVDEQTRLYHRQALAQANVLFWLSVTIATLGFILLSYLMMHTPVGEANVLIRAFPWAMMELTAGLFFRQAREVRERAAAFCDQIHADKCWIDALNLTESIDDPIIQVKVKAELALRRQRMPFILYVNPARYYRRGNALSRERSPTLVKEAPRNDFLRNRLFMKKKR